MISLLNARFAMLIGAENKVNKESLNQWSAAFHPANFFPTISSAFSSFFRDSLKYAMAKGFREMDEKRINSSTTRSTDESIENEWLYNKGVSPEKCVWVYRNFSARHSRSRSEFGSE